jgi:uncharacterized protein
VLGPIISRFLYKPRAVRALQHRRTPAELGLAYEDVTLHASDGVRLSAWYVPAPDARRALLYLHGNSGDLHGWVGAAVPFVRAGCSVLLLDYRGYGRSAGRPGEAGLLRDGEAAWAWLQERESRLPLAVMGKSLGSGVAAHVAARYKPDSLVLDSAYTSLREVVREAAPWVPAWGVPRLYETLDIAGQIACPTLLLHGTNDTLIGPAHARRLYAALRCPKALVLIEGAAHSSLHSFPQYEAAISAFIESPLEFVRKTNTG